MALSGIPITRRLSPILIGILFLFVALMPGCSSFEHPPLEVVPQAARYRDLDLKVWIRGVGGIEQAGSLGEAPIQIEIQEAESKTAVAEIPIEILLHSQTDFDSKTGLLKGESFVRRVVLLSDHEGKAQAHYRTPKKASDMSFRIQILGPEGEPALETEEVIYVVDPRALLFKFLGGLAIFLFGMRLMTQALQAIAGDRLRNVLESLTRHRLVGLMAGAGITAVIQSSSAMTVMVVGLVNASLLTLEQAVPVMFGANIGTTITAQIIAFKISKYAFAMLFLGFLGIILGGSRRQQYLGEVVFGLAMLFLGMDLMGSVFKPLTHSTEIQAVFVGFSVHPIYGVLAGTLVTVLIQSSSATVGLTLTLASAGFLDFQGAFSLILGDNIGTTITAVLASLNGRPAARRTALVHTLFNVVGAGVMLALLYVPYQGHPVYLTFVDWLTPGDPWADPIHHLPRHIANSHALFNLVFAFAFLPLSGAFARLARVLIPGEDEDGVQRVSHLVPNLLETPPLALQSARLEMADMARELDEMLRAARRGFSEGKSKHFRLVERIELQMDRMREDISNYLVKVSEHELDQADAERIPRFLHMVNDLERFGDLTHETVALGRRRYEKNLPFTEEALQELGKLFDLIERMLSATEELLRKGDQEKALAVIALEAEIDRVEDRARRSHIKRLQNGECHLIAGIVFLDYLTVVEKMGDFLHNVAIAMREP